MEHGIGIAHQHQRHVGVARPEAIGDREDIGGARARAERAQIGALDSGAVRHRIGKRHAKLDHIGTAFDQGIEDRGRGGRGRIAAGDEADQGRTALGKGSREAAHIRAPIALATVAISLSPRPDRLITTI